MPCETSASSIPSGSLGSRIIVQLSVMASRSIDFVSTDQISASCADGPLITTDEGMSSERSFTFESNSLLTGTFRATSLVA
ncbi:MAG: hypothetical protein IKZ78_01560 [Firmicutes bacterium]|nr:hypothetical protein [Bacillota bacterium]